MQGPLNRDRYGTGVPSTAGLGQCGIIFQIIESTDSVGDSPGVTPGSTENYLGTPSPLKNSRSWSDDSTASKVLTLHGEDLGFIPQHPILTPTL